MTVCSKEKRDYKRILYRVRCRDRDKDGESERERERDETKE